MAKKLNQGKCFFCSSVIDENIFAYVSNDFKKKIYFPKKEYVEKMLSKNVDIFLSEFFSFSQNLLKRILIASKIGAKLNFSSKFLANKSRKSQKHEMKILLNEKNVNKFGKPFFHTFQNIAHLMGPKTQLCHFWREGGRGVCMSFSRKCPDVLSRLSLNGQIVKLISLRFIDALL